jgi:hypothetical protein
MFAMLLTGGCGTPAPEKKSIPKVDPPQERRLNTGSGEVSKRKSDDKHPDDRRLIWTVKWQQARLAYADDRNFSGSMTAVTGIIYEAGKPVSSFQADQARADRGSNTLTLIGHVIITSKNPPSKLTCNQVEWDATSEIIKATGNVWVDALDYEMGAYTELWASPKMNHMGTPDTFQKKKTMGDPKHES